MLHAGTAKPGNARIGAQRIVCKYGRNNGSGVKSCLCVINQSKVVQYLLDCVVNL